MLMEIRAETGNCWRGQIEGGIGDFHELHMRIPQHREHRPPVLGGEVW